MSNPLSKSLRLLPSLTLLTAVAASSRAAGWSDDFNDGNVVDGNPITWSQNPHGLFPGNYNPSSGDYALSHPGNGNNNQLVTWVESANFTDVYVRTRGVVLPGPAGEDGGNLALLGRLDATTLSAYLLYLDDGGQLGLQRSAGGQVTDLVPTVNSGVRASGEVMLELSIVGSQLSGYAWRPGEAKPLTPQITATDGTFVTGRAGIAFDEDDDNTTGVFRFVTAQDTAIGVSQWRPDAGGNWSVAGNWIGGVPNRPDTDVPFGPVTTAARTVTVNSPHTLATLNFNNAVPYTVAGPGTLTVAGGGINVIDGAHTISAPLTLNGDTRFAVSGSGTLTVTSQMTAAAGAAVTKDGAGTLAVRNVRAAGLTVNEGVVKILNNGGADGVSVVNSLVFPAGQLDLTDNALVVEYADPFSPLADVRTAVVSGYGGGNWTGNGIISSTAAADPTRAVGYGEASSVLGPAGGTFVGQAVDGTAVLVRLTLKGDANLDGVVGFPDLVALAQNYNTLTGDVPWNRGDFTHDGNVDFTDLVALAQNYGAALPGAPIPGAPAGFEGDLARAMAQVPEPAAAGLALFAGAIAGRRRRR